MKTKTIIFFVWFFVGLSVLSYSRNQSPLESINPALSRDKLLESKAFASPIKTGRRYEWRIHGTVDVGTSEHPYPADIDGVLGYGSSQEQLFLNYKGRIGNYDLNIDRLQEEGKVYIRTHSVVIGSGDEQQLFLSKLLGRLAQTNGKFVYLRDFDAMPWIGRVLQPQKVLQSVSEAISFNALECDLKKDICPLLVDPDMISSPTQTKDLFQLINAFMIWIDNQNIVFRPKKSTLEIQHLSDGTQDISATLDPNKLHVLYSTRGLLKSVYDIDHVVQGNTHTVDLQLDRQEHTLYSLRAKYELYPDGRDLKLDNMLSDTTIDIEGRWYDVGGYIPVQRGDAEDIYGILGTKN